MAAVQIGDHDPNAQDTSTPEQSTIDQITGEQQRAEERELRQIEAAVVAVIDPVMEIAQQAETAIAMGHGYVFDPGLVQSLLNRAQDQRDRLVSYRQMIEAFERLDLAPAQDPAGSILQASAVRRSFTNLDVRIRSQVGFLVDWINKLNRAKQNYMRQEHLTETQWQRLTLGLR